MPRLLVTRIIPPGPDAAMDIISSYSISVSSETSVAASGPKVSRKICLLSYPIPKNAFSVAKTILN